EVRGWRGFHHHATLCIAAYAFLIVERGLFSLWRNRGTSRGTLSQISRGERPCGSAHTTGTTQSNFDCDLAGGVERCNGQSRTSVPVLPKIQRPHVIIS